MSYDRSHALDHVVVVLFENRSLDNVLGRLYGPEDGKTFEGVIGKDLESDPGVGGARRRAQGGAVHGRDGHGLARIPTPARSTRTPTRSSSTSRTNRTVSRSAGDITAPFNAPKPGQTPTMDGFVTDYISCFIAEMGRQPTYEEYSQIMTGFTP